MAYKTDEYTKEELQKKLKSQKLIHPIHGFIIILLFAVAGLQTYENGFSFSSFFPLFFIPMQIFIHLEIKKLKKQLKSRS